MSSPTDDSRKTKAIRSCVERLRSCLKDRFILIGGASLLLLGSQRPTNDVDILVPSDEDVAALVSFLAADKSFSNEGGHLQFQHPDFSPSLDILTIAVERMTFEQAHPHCLTIKEVKVPKPDYSLGLVRRRFTGGADLRADGKGDLCYDIHRHWEGDQSRGQSHDIPEGSVLLPTARRQERRKNEGATSMILNFSSRGWLKDRSS